MRWLVLVMLCMAALAQESVKPPSRDIAKLLKSKKASDLAWAAMFAEESRDKKWVPEMIHLLERERRTDEDRLVPYYAFEALMRLDATLPEKMLLPMAKEYLRATLVLVARNLDFVYPPELPKLLDLEINKTERLEVMRLLRNHPTPDYTERSLREWTLEAALHVISPAQTAGDAIEEIAITTSGGWGEWGPPQREAPKRFPQFPQAFYSARFGGDYATDRMVDSERDQYIRSLVTLRFPDRTVVYRDGPQVMAEAEALRAEATRFVDSLLETLIAKGHLRGDNAVRPPVSIRITDSREDKSVPLPEFR